MITRSTSIVHLSFLAGGTASSLSGVSISITSSPNRWKTLIGLEDFEFTVLVHAQASLLPLDC